MRSLAEAIASVLAVPVESVPADRFGVLGGIFSLDQRSSSALTRERLGWEPTNPSLLEDLAAGGFGQKANGQCASMSGPLVP
jgi:hypothetical protein